MRQSVKVAVVKAEQLVDALHKMLIEVKRYTLINTLAEVEAEALVGSG